MNYLVVRLLNFFRNKQLLLHWVKSVRIRNNSGHYFPTILVRIFPHSGSASLRIRSEYGKVRTMITPNTDTFHAVLKLQYQIFLAASLIYFPYMNTLILINLFQFHSFLFKFLSYLQLFLV